MPFKSEKQRRYLWATHPDIARRWADEYPKPKNLPMYVQDKDLRQKEPRAKKKHNEKKSFDIKDLRQIVVNNTYTARNPVIRGVFSMFKQSDSKLEHVTMPQADEPTSAGEQQINSILKPETEDEGSVGRDSNDPGRTQTDACEQQIEKNPLLQKLSVVLAPKIMQEIENRKAREQARQAQRMPQNVNIKQYPVASAAIPPPMGMQQPPAPQAAPAQPQPGAHHLAAVGGGNSPNANPINSYGGLSMNGDINGNAAFGTANSMGGEKLSNDGVLSEIMGIHGSVDPEEIMELDELWLDNLRAKCASALKQQKCSCGCGQKVAECTCPESCSCRQKGGSCYGLKLEKAAKKLDHVLNTVGPVLLRGNRGVLEGGLIGSGIGGVYGLLSGAYQTEKGKKLQGALRGLVRGAAGGGLIGGGAGLGAALSLPRDGRELSYRDDTLPAAGGALAGGSAGLAGILLANALKTKEPKEEKKEAAAKPGLWANIHAKRKRGEKPAKPGDKDYPDSKSWQKTVKSAGLFDFLKSQPEADDWAPPPMPKSNWRDEDYDDEAYDKQYAQWEKDLRRYLKTKGYSQIKQHYYEPGGTPLSMRGPDGKHHEIWYPEDDEPIRKPVALEDIYDSDDPKQVYRSGPGLALVGPKQAASSPAWQRSAGKNPEGGLNEKGRKSYERETGGNLKAPVTESKPTGERAKRQNSFCSRMCGMKRVNTGAKTKSDPDSRINKSLRKWNCKCSSAFEFGEKLSAHLAAR